MERPEKLGQHKLCHCNFRNGIRYFSFLSWEGPHYYGVPTKLISAT